MKRKFLSGKQESRKRTSWLRGFQIICCLLLIAHSALAYVAKPSGDIDTLIAAGYGTLTTQRCKEIGTSVKSCRPEKYNELYAILQTSSVADERAFAATLFTAGNAPIPTPTPPAGPASSISTGFVASGAATDNSTYNYWIEENN